MDTQLRLFDAPVQGPPGFNYRADIIPAAEENALLEAMAGLPFKEFDFHGHRGKRRVVSFGWKYDFSAGELQRAEAIPGFLLPCATAPPDLPASRRRICSMSW